MDQNTPFSNKEFRYLAKKWLNKTITEQEKEQFDAWYNQFSDEEAFVSSPLYDSEEVLKEQLYNDILKARQVGISIEKRKPSGQFLLKIAAILFLVSTIVLVLYYQRSDNRRLLSVSARKSFKQIGSSEVQITLGNGQQVSLNEAKGDLVLAKNGLTIKKNQQGELVFQVDPNQQTDDTTTIEIPKQSQYQLILPDHTKVWLNASSKLHFPSSFHGPQRQVKLQGEAYFEVAENSRKPFIVLTDKQEVQVLGTSFNIHAYSNEPLHSTTLVSGAVRIKAKTTHLLQPGEQLEVTSVATRIKQVDLDEVTAWTRGLFVFKNTPLPEMMNTLAEWYPIDVIYKRKADEEVFNGEIDKTYTVKELVSVLNAGGINCQLSDNTIIIKN